MAFTKAGLKKEKPLLKQISIQERTKFYVQEVFGCYKSMKKYIIIIVLYVMVTEIVKNLVTSINQDGMLVGIEISAVNIPLAIGCVAYGILFLNKFQSKAKNSIIPMFCLLFIASASVSISFGLHIYYFFQKVAVLPLDKEIVYYGTCLFASGIYWFMLIHVMTPVWSLKILVPMSYFIGLIVGLYELDIGSFWVGWLHIIRGTISIILLCWLKSNMRWKLFIEKQENENFNEVHKLILNKVPNPIVVFNENGEALYSNPEFNNLAMGDVEAFMSRITDLKRRRNLKDQEDGSLHQQDSNLKPDRSLSIEDMKLSQGMRRAKTIGPYEVIEESEDLGKLLLKIRKLFKEGTMNDEIYLVFDGKLKEESKSQKDSSFEVTLSFISEYQKIIVILKDTTEHAKIIALETNNQYKDKLLASVSHELRTPLNSNLSLVEAALNHEEIPQNLKDQYLVPAHRSGKLLFHIINDILDYSQIAARKLRLNFDELPIRDTINGCCQLLELQVHKKGLELNVTIDPDVPNFFLTDHDRVRQIILNLLSNALKFTFQGKISLRAKVIDIGQIKIIVEDSGIGIKPDDLKKLFHEFTRINNNAERGNLNAQGVGLGLTIADKIAKLLGPKGRLGGIKVDSIFGKGSKFSFIINDKSREKSVSRIVHEEGDGRTADTQRIKDISSQLVRDMSYESFDKLEEGVTRIIDQTARYIMQSNRNSLNEIMCSLKQPDSQNNLQSELLLSSIRRRKKRMLVVDDDPFNILAIESFLKKHSIEIECAYNGKEAILKVQQTVKRDKIYGFDLIFMDCQMPVMDGYEATRILSEMMKKGELPDIPIIGCTAFDANKRIELCYEAGMREVINKPLSQVKVEKILKSFIN